MILKFESKVSKAGSHGDSTKTTVPKPIVELLKVKFGDKIVWNVEILGKDEFRICVTPKKE